MSTHKILIIEDERDNQELMAEIFSIFNIAYETVDSGEEALRRLQTDTFAAAIVDLHLPGIDGFTLFEYIREQAGYIPCIAITAYHNSGVRKRAVDAGFDAYFSKPFDHMALIRRVKMLTGEIST